MNVKSKLENRPVRPIESDVLGKLIVIQENCVCLKEPPTHFANDERHNGNHTYFKSYNTWQGMVVGFVSNGKSAKWMHVIGDDRDVWVSCNSKRWFLET